MTNTWKGEEYTDDEVEEIFELMHQVMMEANGGFADYAKTYAEHSWQAFEEDGHRGLQMQIPYVLSNLQGWKGDLARKIKLDLKKFLAE
jgi:hypothetical protein